MKKFINNNDDFLKESLTGFGKAHSDIINVNLDPSFVSRKNKTKDGKVSLISGGGSGHEPMHGGFVGHGMLDAACPGFVFSAPTPDQMQAAAEHVDSGAGVLFIVKNYSGDIMNFQMGAEMYSGKNDSIVTNDDVAVEDSTFTTGRRGVAATVLVEKIVGSLAENGGGIHGEPGRKREKIQASKTIVGNILEAILDNLKPEKNEKNLLFVNGMGGTPLTELYLVYEDACQILQSKGVQVTKSLVGNYCTSLEMQGASITLLKCDDEILKHWDSPVHTAAMRWGM
jgi:dihydroxyacetone kinase-like protein